MSTLISVYNSDGCVGRCDAKCYEAECEVCNCICGGVNHGVGLSKAQDNTRKYADEWIEKYKEENGADVKGEINIELLQLNLF